MRERRENGEIIEVESGGRIVRSLRRKDRHSKVCTSKGPKDRRVRLSANTAIQFYDVQDRLGYDRPSKAIDWLMKEAKPAIDALECYHRDHGLRTTVQDTSEAFPPTAVERNQQVSNEARISGFEGYPLGLIDPRNKNQENPSEELTPMNLSWNPSYVSGDGEPLQSSTIIDTCDNEFLDDEAFLGFDFPQKNQLEEMEYSDLLSKTRRYS